MRSACLLALMLLVCAGAARADFTYPDLPETGASLDAFVPSGWKVLGQAKGDLDKDGVDDIAAVIERQEGVEHVPGCDKWRTESARSPRSLILLIGEEGGGYALSARDNHIVLRSDEGGVFGDPFYEIGIERGAVVLNHYGGSAWRWAHVHRFRYQDGGWYLIGYTDTSHHTLSQFERVYDFNVTTGKIKVTSKGEDGRTGCYRCFVGDACPKTADCPENETRAPGTEFWKDLGKSQRIPLARAACIDIVPTIPYQ